MARRRVTLRRQMNCRSTPWRGEAGDGRCYPGSEAAIARLPGCPESGNVVPGDAFASGLRFLEGSEAKDPAGIRPGGDCPVARAVAGEAIEGVPRGDDDRGRFHLLQSPKSLDGHLLILQVELTPESFCVLSVEGSNGVLLQAEQRRRRGDANADPFHRLRLGRDGVERRRLAKTCHDVEIQIATRR